jgi:outer membrane receptor protein involved in Fe transport
VTCGVRYGRIPPHAFGRWRVQRALELRAIVRNLLDDRYHASPDARWVLAPGRSISATAVLQF